MVLPLKFNWKIFFQIILYGQVKERIGGFGAFKKHNFNEMAEMCPRAYFHM